MKNYCEECGRTEEELLELNIRLTRHHEDYSKPREFETLCSECHGKRKKKKEE